MSFDFDIGDLVLSKSHNKNVDLCFYNDLKPKQVYLFEDLVKSYKTESSRLRTKINAEKKNYSEILDRKSIQNVGLAERSSGKIFEYEKSLNKIKAVFFHTFYYKILLTKQRRPFVSCLTKKLKK